MVAGLFVAAPVQGQAREHPPDVPETPPTASSEAVRDAPAPGRARGVMSERAPPGDSSARTVARAILWVPRGLFLGLAYPPRAALYLEDRYRLRARAVDLFFNDARTFGVYPGARLDTGFGLTVGARMIWRDSVDRRQALRLGASYGGRLDYLYGLHASTGKRLGALRLELTGRFSSRDGERFYGIGNGDIAGPPPAPIAVVPDGPAIEARFRESYVAGRLDAQVRGGRTWLMVLSGGADHYEFFTDNVDVDDGTNIGEVFALDTVTGFEPGVDLASGNLELRYDSRGPGRLAPPASFARGALASIFGGYSVGPGGRWDFVRYGVEGQLVRDLHRQTRVLILRALVDGVSGDYDQIPVVALPRLGGDQLLRGYEVDRFRDRVAGLASVEYTWQVSGALYGFLFADAGRVAGTIDDLSTTGLRVGYGGGLHIFTRTASLARVQLASSIDGGLFAHVVLDEVFAPMWREERR